MFLEAAKAVAALVAPSDLAIGRLLPPLASIREVSAHVALAVAEVAFHDGHASVDRPADPQALVRSTMWYPAYPEYA